MKMKKQGFFDKFCHWWHFDEGGPDPFGHTLATPMILRQDRFPNKFIKKKQQKTFKSKLK